MSLRLKYEFERENPPGEDRFSTGSVEKGLNMSLLEDCITGQQLRRLAAMDCSDPAQINSPTEIHFSQVYARNLILGATTDTFPLFFKGIPEDD